MATKFVPLPLVSSKLVSIIIIYIYIGRNLNIIQWNLFTDTHSITDTYHGSDWISIDRNT